MNKVGIEAEKQILVRLVKEWVAAENRKDIDAACASLHKDIIARLQ